MPSSSNCWQVAGQRRKRLPRVVVLVDALVYALETSALVFVRFRPATSETTDVIEDRGGLGDAVVDVHLFEDELPSVAVEVVPRLCRTVHRSILPVSACFLTLNTGPHDGQRRADVCSSYGEVLYSALVPAPDLGFAPS